MDLIRQKISLSKPKEQLKLLTLSPQTCSRESLTYFFGVSDYLVHESRVLFKKSGILGDVEPKRGKIMVNYIQNYIFVMRNKDIYR